MSGGLKFANRGLLHKLVPSVLRLRLSSGEPNQPLASEEEGVLISKSWRIDVFIATPLGAQWRWRKRLAVEA